LSKKTLTLSALFYGKRGEYVGAKIRLFFETTKFIYGFFAEILTFGKIYGTDGHPRQRPFFNKQ